MLEVLKFIFSDLWIFTGFLVLFSVLCQTVLNIWKSILEYRLRKLKEAYTVKVELGENFKEFIEDDVKS